MFLIPNLKYKFRNLVASNEVDQPVHDFGMQFSIEYVSFVNKYYLVMSIVYVLDDCQHWRQIGEKSANLIFPTTIS